MKQNDMSGEWLALHNSIDHFERFSLLIKLLATLLLFCGVAFALDPLLIIFVMLVLWLQDAIWKTFQSRAETRILLLEQMISKEAGDNDNYQFYTDWQNQRPSVTGLLASYASQALKPTLAYPYVVLIAFVILYQGYI